MARLPCSPLDGDSLAATVSASAGTSLVMKAFMINVPERDGLGAPFCEDAHFFVRTLEKGAHLRRNHRDYPRCALSKTVRIFEGGAYLRTRAPPWTRCRRRVRA